MSGWAALGEAAMGLANTGLGLWAQSKAARRQWAQQKEALQNQHQWEVADLRKAGLNPILSVNAGAGGASGGNAAFPLFDVGKNLNKFSESDLLKAQAGAAQAQEKANSAIAENQYEQSVLAGVASRNLAADTVLKQNSAKSQDIALDLQRKSYQWIQDHPHSRDFGQWIQTINPFNSTGGAVNSASGVMNLFK